jgi:hypothetical protein
VIANEDDDGELSLHIGEELFTLLVDYLQADNRAIASYLEQLPLRSIVRLERLAANSPDLARDYLRRITDNGIARPRLALV